MIEPRTLKGFRDYPPELMLPREHLLEQARKVYRSYGFSPIDTPAMEYAEILLGKGGEESDRIVYRFKDHGDRDVALRFDLTVPFARFAAQHIGQLGTPFKRYAMGPVWRGENTSAGRYREFVQCDFDTIGTTSNAADIETSLVIFDLMRALGFENFTIRVNNRLVLNGLLEQLGLSNQAVPLLRALDKLAKIGREGVIAEMMDGAENHAGVTREQAEAVLRLAETTGSNVDILNQIDADFGKNPQTAEGIARLRELLAVTARAGVPEKNLVLDLAICRGLDYYTGTIYETFLDDLPKIGSVCSGGRYDNLAGLYTKQALPGVGASLGLDRLLAAMETLALLPKTSTAAPVFVVQFSQARLGDYQRIARMLRGAGIGVEVFPEATKLGKQFSYAEKRGFRFAIVAGDDEFQAGIVKVKDLAARQEISVAEADLVATLQAHLKPA
ncbi:histidine--tRNA ligase [Tuwongella immobilis]|uniref:histidine--tRNA ligase n=1 Tax=Tuwongella immobilis TaxID=692036 RepID=UPI0013A6DAF8